MIDKDCLLCMDIQRLSITSALSLLHPALGTRRQEEIP